MAVSFCYATSVWPATGAHAAQLRIMEQTGKELCQQTEHPQSGSYCSGLRHRSCQERPPAQVVRGTAHERFDFANTREETPRNTSAPEFQVIRCRGSKACGWPPVWSIWFTMFSAYFGHGGSHPARLRKAARLWTWGGVAVTLVMLTSG